MKPFRLTSTLLPLLLGLIFSLQLKADEASIKIVYPPPEKEPSIHDFKWESDTFHVKKTEEGELIGELRGEFIESNWCIFSTSGDQDEDKKLLDSTKEGEPFVLSIPIQGEKTHVILRAIGPKGETKKDEFDLQYNNWPDFLKLRLCKTQYCLKSFQLIPIYMTSHTGSMGTTMISWTPFYQEPRFRIQGSLGLMPVRTPTGSWYPVLEYGFLGSVVIKKPFWIEALVGMQSWTDYSTHSPILGSNLVYRLNRKLLFWMDQFSLGYSVLFSPDGLTHEFRSGVGLSF